MLHCFKLFSSHRWETIPYAASFLENLCYVEPSIFHD